VTGWCSVSSAERGADFAVGLPLLDTPARQWLKNAPEVAHPGHTWRDEL